jgi:hypothetical protein
MKEGNLNEDKPLFRSLLVSFRTILPPAPHHESPSGYPPAASPLGPCGSSCCLPPLLLMLTLPLQVPLLLLLLLPCCPPLRVGATPSSLQKPAFQVLAPSTLLLLPLLLPFSHLLEWNFSRPPGEGIQITCSLAGPLSTMLAVMDMIPLSLFSWRGERTLR